MKRYFFVEEELQKRDETHQRRFLQSLTPIRGTQVVVVDEPLVNFCSNDYLGLSKHPLLKERGIEFFERLVPVQRPRDWSVETSSALRRWKKNWPC